MATVVSFLPNQFDRAVNLTKQFNEKCIADHSGCFVHVLQSDWGELDGQKGVYADLGLVYEDESYLPLIADLFIGPRLDYDTFEFVLLDVLSIVFGDELKVEETE